MNAMIVVLILNGVTLFFIGLSLYFQVQTRKLMNKNLKTVEELERMQVAHRKYIDRIEED